MELDYSKHFREEHDLELHWDLEEPTWNRKSARCTKQLSQWINEQIFAKEKITHLTKKLCSAHFIRYQTVYSILLPVLIAHTIWWPTTTTTMSLEVLFTATDTSYHRPRWNIGLILAFISFLTGSIGGAGTCVLFPIMTLLLGTSPNVARDFYFLVQSISALCAGCTICTLELNVSFPAITYSGIGGVIGVIIGLEAISTLQSAYAKMYIACIWFAFCISLFVCNIYHNGKVFHNIPSWEKGNCLLVLNWRAGVLLLAGVLGGVMSSVSGSGVELLATSVLVLMFRVSERISTPTVVLLTAVNALTAALYREFVMGDVDKEVYRMLLVCVPIVAICAPLGVVVGTYLHRNFLLCAFYMTCSAQLLAALLIVRPWTDHSTLTPADLSTKSLVLLVASTVFFVVLFLAGQHLLAFVDRRGLHDESTLPKARPQPKATKKPITDEEEGQEAEETKSDDLNGYRKLSLYACKESVTPPDREDSLIIIPLSFEEMTGLEA